VPTAEQIRQIKEFHAKEAPGEVQRAAAGFNVRLPSALPAGTVLAHAAAFEEKSDAGKSLHSLDVWFVLPSGDQLPVWQTDAQLTDKDPVTSPGSIDLPVKGMVWKRAKTDFAGIDSFSTRFSDGA
jgi:hypothetical protein